MLDWDNDEFLWKESRSNMLLLYCTLHPSTGEEEQVPQASAVLYFTPI